MSCLAEDESLPQWRGTSLNMDDYDMENKALLGTGATSKVYYACRHSSASAGSTTQRTPSEIALKLMPNRAKVDAEVKILASLQRHPNIVDVYGVCLMKQDPKDEELLPAIQMEYCEVSLQAAVVRHRYIEYEAHIVIFDVFSGLAHLHKQDILHRDVKPANVLLTRDGKAKLTDFGNAALLSDAEAMGARCGTPGFAAPELLLGHKYGLKVDTFSAGALLYYIISGKPVFTGSTVKSILQKTIVCPVNMRRSVCLERLSDFCKEFILTLLEKNPEDRPPASDVLCLLSGVHPEPSDEAVEPTPDKLELSRRRISLKLSSRGDDEAVEHSELDKKSEDSVYPSSSSEVTACPKSDGCNECRSSSKASASHNRCRSKDSVEHADRVMQDNGFDVLEPIEPLIPSMQAPARRSPATRRYSRVKTEAVAQPTIPEEYLFPYSDEDTRDSSRSTTGPRMSTGRGDTTGSSATQTSDSSRSTTPEQDFCELDSDAVLCEYPGDHFSAALVKRCKRRIPSIFSRVSFRNLQMTRQQSR